MEAERQRVLVIDDEAGLRRSLRFGLYQRGYAVDEVEEGLPALKLIERSYHDGAPYRCIVTDICLPDIDGLKLVELIKSTFPTLPIVVVSAFGNASTEDDVSKRRGDAFLPKPFLVDQLTTVMGTLRPPQVQPPAAPAVEKVAQGAYVLVRIADGADMMKVFQQLYFMDCAVYTDAVHGEPYQVVMLVTAPSHAEVQRLVAEHIRATPGVAEAIVCPIVPPRIDPVVREFIEHYDQSRAVDPATEKMAAGRKALNTYLFVDIQPGRHAETLPRLHFLPGIVSCDPTEGRHDAILLFQTSDFADHARVLAEELKRIDGIACARSAKVVHVYEL